MNETGEPPAAPPAEKPARHDLPWLRPFLLFCVLGLYFGNALCTNVEFTPGHVINSALALPGAGLLLLIYAHYARGLRRGKLVAWLLAPVLVLACVAALARGYPNFGWSAYPASGRWIVLGMLSAGMAAALVYLIDAAVRRVRLPLGAWLVLLCAHAAGMVLVNRYFVWRAGVEGTGAAAWSVDLAFLALALAVLLLRAGVVAARSAEWWPEWLVHASGSSVQAAAAKPLRFPRLPVVLLYACSPLLWWLAGLYLLEFSVRGGPTAGGTALFAAIWAGLCLRAACAGGAIYGAEYALRKARKAGDPVRNAASEAFLFRNGLAWAGLLAIYAFFFTAQRVQQNELARVLQATEAPLVAEMRAIQPPAITPRANAANWYRKALTTLPAVSTYKIFVDGWQTPDAVKYVRSAATALSDLGVANSLSGCEWCLDYGASVEELGNLGIGLSDYRNLANLLLLNARYAGLDRDWAALLADVQGALLMARRFESSPELLNCLIGFGLEQDAVMALLPALLWHPDGPAEEAWLAKAQQMLLEYDRTRGHPFADVLRCDTLLSLRSMNRDHAGRVEVWPGGADLATLRREMPLLAWLDRGLYIAWQERLQAFAAEPASESGLERMRAQNPLHRFGASPESCVSDWQVGAALRMARAALAAARYRLSRGTWPPDLGHCVPEFLEAVPGGMFEQEGPMRIAVDPPRIWYGPPSFNPGEHLRYDREKDNMTAVGPRGHFDGAFFLEPPLVLIAAVEGWRHEDPAQEAMECEELRNPEAQVWENAALNLAAMGENAWFAREDVFAMAGEKEAERRMWAAFLLGTMGHGEDPVGAHLEHLAKDADPDVARVARWSQLWLRALARREAGPPKNAAPMDAAAEPLKE